MNNMPTVKNAISFMDTIEMANALKVMLGEMKYTVSVRNGDDEIGRVSTCGEFINLISENFHSQVAQKIFATEPKSTTVRREFKITYCAIVGIKENIRLIVE